MTLKRITSLWPAISAGELRAHMRSFNSEEAALQLGYILAAQNDIELCAERALTVAKYRLTLPDFPGRSGSWMQGGIPFEDIPEQGISVNGSAILLNMPPVRKIDAVSYYSGANTVTAYTEWNLFADSEPAELRQTLDTTWPATYRRRDAVTVTFWAGELVPLTYSAAANTFTSPTGFAFTDGDTLVLSKSGNNNAALGDVAVLPSGVAEKTTYFVRDSTGTTFKLAETSGGAAIDLVAPSTSGESVDLIFAGELEPIHRLALLQMAAKGAGERCPQGGCICSKDDFEGNPILRRLLWRSPVEFV